MSDDVMPYAGLPLRGEKVSIASPRLAPVDVTIRDMAATGRETIRDMTATGRDLIGVGRELIGAAVVEGERWVPAIWPGLALCGALALWAAPALLFTRYQLGQLFEALVRVSLKPSASDLLTLSLVLIYLVLTGLMLGRVAASPRHRASRLLLRCAIAPFVAFSMVAILVAAVPLFFGAVVFCFPQLV